MAAGQRRPTMWTDEGETTAGRNAQPEVLFVCVHNAGRSQMAAGLTHLLSGGQINVRSAGSEPADRVNPAVVQAMDELGIDLSHELPKPLTGEAVAAAD